MADKNDEVELVPIPMDQESIKRLARLGRFLGEHPVDCAASLLHDILRDDEMENGYPVLATDQPLM